jgi:hypothetical protein
MFNFITFNFTTYDRPSPNNRLVGLSGLFVYDAAFIVDVINGGWLMPVGAFFLASRASNPFGKVGGSLGSAKLPPLP